MSESQGAEKKQPRARGEGKWGEDYVIVYREMFSIREYYIAVEIITTFGTEQT